ncbi:hypothetical protein BH09ACT11_BH09ACT11_06580 [soil metagenome]
MFGLLSAMDADRIAGPAALSVPLASSAAKTTGEVDVVGRDDLASTPIAEAQRDTSEGAPVDDPRRMALADYVTSQRERGEELPYPDEAWVSAAIADPKATIGRLPLKIQRKHTAAIEHLLGYPSKPAGLVARPPDLLKPAGSDFALKPDLFVEHATRRRIDAQSNLQGAVSLKWPEVPKPEVGHFRVVAGIEGRIPLLFEGRDLGITEDGSLVDAEALDTPRRHYAVWVYRGPTDAKARQAQPELWARGVVLRTVQSVQVSVVGDDVSGTWVTPDGVDRVEVYRLPAASGIEFDRLSEAHLRSGSASGENLTGFEDRDLQAGEYEYRFYACSNVDGQVLRSAAATKAVVVVVPVPEIEDLDVTADENRSVLQVEWLAPSDSGVQVEIHLTGTEPPAGIRGRELDADALARNGFDDRTQQNFPVRTLNGRTVFRLDWPQGLDRVHLTAVSCIGQSFKVGASRAMTRVGTPRQVRLVERVDEQYLTFGWPSGADFVEVRRARPEASETDPQSWTELAQIPKEKHERFGGLHLNPLPVEGCMLDITGLAYQAGERIVGEPVRIRYPGLTRLRYEFVERFEPQGRFRKATVAGGTDLVVSVDRDVDVPIVLVRNRDALPLHRNDGERILTGRVRLGAAQPQTVWTGLQQGRQLTGFVRLLVDLPDAEQHLYAVLDAPIDQLRRG